MSAGAAQRSIELVIGLVLCGVGVFLFAIHGLTAWLAARQRGRSPWIALVVKLAKCPGMPAAVAAALYYDTLRPLALALPPAVTGVAAASAVTGLAVARGRALLRGHAFYDLTASAVWVGLYLILRHRVDWANLLTFNFYTLTFLAAYPFSWRWEKRDRVLGIEEFPRGSW